MTEDNLDALRRALAGEGSTARRFRTVAAKLLAGEVVRMPEAPTERLGSDWSFLDRYRDAFAEYVGIAGFRVLVDEDYKFACLVHDDPALRETLDKATSRVAVACRLLYHREQQTVHLTAGVEVTMRDLLERLDLTGGVGNRTPRIKTLEALRTLARFEMVSLPPRFSGYEEERFMITPVLPRRLPLTSIQDYLERTRPGRLQSGSETIGAGAAHDELENSNENDAGNGGSSKEPDSLTADN